MHEFTCVECGNGTDTSICTQCLHEFRQEAAEVERLRAKASDLETENQTLLVRVENRDNEIKRLKADYNTMLEAYDREINRRKAAEAKTES